MQFVKGPTMQSENHRNDSFPRHTLFLASRICLTGVLWFAPCVLGRVSLAQPVSWPQPGMSGSPQSNVNESPVQLGTLSGTIVTSQSAGVAGTCVEIRAMSSMESALTVCTGLDGSFEVRDMPLGDYEIVASSGEQQVRQVVRVSSRFTTVNVDMSAGSTHQAHGGGASVTAGQLAVPSKAKHALEKAWHAAGKNEVADARKYIASALSAFPHYADAFILSAILDLQDNKPEASASEAQQAVGYDHTNGMAYIVLAAAYNSLSHFGDALRSVENGIRFRPDAWQAYFEKARAELGNRQFKEALADATRCEELNRGRNPVIHLLEGDALVNLRRYQEAVAQLQAYLAKTPEGPTTEYAHKLLAQAQAGLERPPQ